MCLGLFCQMCGIGSNCPELIDVYRRIWFSGFFSGRKIISKYCGLGIMNFGIPLLKMPFYSPGSPDCD